MILYGGILPFHWLVAFPTIPNKLAYSSNDQLATSTGCLASTVELA